MLGGGGGGRRGDLGGGGGERRLSLVLKASRLKSHEQC